MLSLTIPKIINIMATVKVKFRPSKKKGHAGKIVFIVKHEHRTKHIKTKYRLFPHEWDEKHSIPLADTDNMRQEIKETIQKIKLDIERLNNIIKDLDNRHYDYPIEEIVDKFQHMDKENKMFKFMDKVISEMKHQKHNGTVHNYIATRNSFRQFRENKDIPLELVDSTLIESYQLYLKARQLTPNTISFYMRVLRAVYNRAVLQELTKDRKPFHSVFTGTEKTLKRAISINDIKRIKKLDLTSRPELEFARDIFIFLFFCRGMSFIDAAFLEKTNIQNQRLTYRRHKTGQLLNIKVINKIEALLGKYERKSTTYLLPIITNQRRDARKQYEAALRRVNNGLKVIGKILQLPIPLTTYVSRHSWATIAKSKNIPIGVISDALGHDSIKTTQIYLDLIDSSTIDKANELITKGL